MFGHLTSSELRKGRDAAEYLCKHAEVLHLDQNTVTTLATLATDLAEEAKSRQEKGELPHRAAPGHRRFAVRR
jgi:hypothetical protein